MATQKLSESFEGDITSYMCELELAAAEYRYLYEARHGSAPCEEMVEMMNLDDFASALEPLR